MTARAEELQLRVPAQPESLALVRAVVTQAAEDASLPEEEVGKVEIAVDEACTNIMEHGYRDWQVSDPDIELRIRREEDRLRIQILDRARPFDMTQYRLPDVASHWENGHTRGVGIYLIHQCMDEIRYERLPDERNMVELIKKFSTPAAAPGGPGE